MGFLRINMETCIFIDTEMYTVMTVMAIKISTKIFEFQMTNSMNPKAIACSRNPMPS